MSVRTRDIPAKSHAKRKPEAPWQLGRVQPFFREPDSETKRGSKPQQTPLCYGPPRAQFERFQQRMELSAPCQLNPPFRASQDAALVEQEAPPFRTADCRVGGAP